MQYYTKRKKHNFLYIIAVIIPIIIILNTMVLFFNNRVMPSIIEIATIMARSQALSIINKKSVEILSEEFKYDEMVKIEKDNEGNIILVQSDTVKLNYIAARLSTECNNELNDMSNTIIEVPFGWMSDNSMFYSVGPTITTHMEQLGNLSTTYESKFESAGINQTRHKIYLNIIGKIRLKLPLRNQEIDVTTQIPVSDTIIVGKIPNTSFGFPTNEKTNND